MQPCNRGPYINQDAWGFAEFRWTNGITILYISKKLLYVYSRIYPAQIAIGKTPKFPSATQDELSALDENTSSPIIAQHLNAISAVQKAYIRSRP